MSTSQSLVETVLHAAQAQGLDQSRLARRAGLRAETVSRAKHRGTIDLASLQALAQAVGLELTLQPVSGTEALPVRRERSPAQRSPLADPKWGLAWSNPDAPADVLVRNALAHGNFDLLLQAVLGHGLAFVKTQWRQVSPTLPTRARQEVERKLNNIEQGLNDAAA